MLKIFIEISTILEENKLNSVGDFVINLCNTISLFSEFSIFKKKKNHQVYRNYTCTISITLPYFRAQSQIVATGLVLHLDAKQPKLLPMMDLDTNGMTSVEMVTHVHNAKCGKHKSMMLRRTNF